MARSVFLERAHSSCYKKQVDSEETVGVASGSAGGQPGVVTAESTGPVESGLSLWTTSRSSWHWCHTCLEP